MIKIEAKKKQVQIVANSWKEGREEAKSLIKVVRDNCFQWLSYEDVIFWDKSYSPVRQYELSPESMMLGMVCPFTNKVLCECDKSGEEQKKYLCCLGRNCGFYECLNPDHIVPFDVDDLAEDIQNGKPIDELEKKYGYCPKEIAHFKRDLEDDFK